MAKVLVTGGTGTIGSAFIERCEETPICMGHSEKRMREFLTTFPEIDHYLCPIENKEAAFSVFEKVQPDVVIHSAAIKHVDFAAKQPIRASEVNVLGSLNIIAASQHFEVPITVAISTDKASDPHSVYGYTKLLMEKCFVEANQGDARFAVCRFGNVVGSAGSVIPIWKSQAAKGEPISITDERMNRFMFSVDSAVGLIQKAVQMCKDGDGGFVLTKLMKVVNVADLAGCISSDVKVIGIRPGEQLEECLFNEEEARRSRVIGDFVRIGEEVVNELTQRHHTTTTEKMTPEELQELIG